MSTTTALDIINSSLRLLQVASPDVVLTAAEANDALDALNLMLDGWSNESMMLHHIVQESFALTPGQAAYTIGQGGQLSTDRPISIESATISISGADYAVQPMAFDDWAVIRLKSLQAYPNYMYLDATYPLGTLNFYPVPIAASTLTLYSRKPFTQFSSLTASFSLPPGYARAMKYQLAIELAPEYQTSAGQDVAGLAMSAKAGIKRTNNRAITSQLDVALMDGGRRFNIYKGS